MDKPGKERFFSHKLPKVISFYKSLNPKYLNFLYVIILCTPFFLMSFQNCKTTNVDTLLPIDLSPKDINFKIGSIIRVDPESGNFIADGLLPIDSDVAFKFINADLASDNYKWTIKRGFDPIVINVATETDTYKTQFSKLGAHDVSAGSYKSTEIDPKTTARKRVVVGESCSLTDILEIELSSESAAFFKVGESGYATFVLKDSANFSSIEWKATLPSGDFTENEEDEDTLTVDLSSESVGTLVIEVSAVSSDTSKAGCLTYRRKELTVTPNVRPYFNPISFTDSRNDIPLTLENNDIYKYVRPETNRYLQIEVLNADSCQYQINDGNKVIFSCSGDLIKISSSADGCTEGVVTLLASNSQGEAHSQSYYHYCPEEGSYCYFGPTSARPGHHVCPRNFPSEADGDQKGINFETDPVSGRCGSVQNTCQTGQLSDITDTATHYKWQCIGTGGGTTVDCETEIPTTTSTSTTTITVTTPSCPSGQYTSQTVCDNANPSNSTCSSRGNRCYGWSCNSGYRKSGNSCVVCTTSSSCNSNKPANSTCSADSNGCYGWSCNSGYIKSGNSCVSSISRVNGVCNNAQRNGCSSGTANDAAIADTATLNRWHCVGSGGGTTANNCQKRSVTCGRCGTYRGDSNASCSAGTFHPHPGHTNTKYQWTCRNIPHEAGQCASIELRCTQAKPALVNGVCNNSQRNGCISGTGNDAAISDTATLYRWHCVGSGGGTTARNCQKAKAPRVNGVCNNSQRNGCSSGTASDSAITDTQTLYRWHCVGSGGGTTANNCQKAKASRVNGVCNNSQRNGCSSGTASDSAITDTQTLYRWHCVGSGGGSTATNCQKSKPPQVTCGRCGSSNETCVAGDPHGHPPDTDTQWIWTCRNSPHQTGQCGSREIQCSKNKPVQRVNGVCNNSQRNGCSSGTANDGAIADTATLNRWHCVGSGGGTTARNCQKAKTVNGVCNNSQRNGCSSGTANDGAIADTATLNRWHCVGSGGGTTARNCQKAKTVNGVCNNTQRNGCSSGTANDGAIADTATLNRWHCVGSGGGTTARNCQKAKTVNGVCNNTQRNGCSSGTANDGAIADTATLNRWHCVGSGGGTTARNCQKTKTTTCPAGQCCPACTGTKLCRNGKCEEFKACGNNCIGQFCADTSCTTSSNCHVKDTGDGVCRPSCGYLAVLQNTGHYGPDGIKLTSDDPHYYSGSSKTCASISGHWGSDWKKILPLDPPNNIEVWEVVEYGGGECCMRTTPVTPPTTPIPPISIPKGPMTR